MEQRGRTGLWVTPKVIANLLLSPQDAQQGNDGKIGWSHLDSARCTNDHVVTQEDEERSGTLGEERLQRLQSCLPLLGEHQEEMTTHVTYLMT